MVLFDSSTSFNLLRFGPPNFHRHPYNMAEPADPVDADAARPLSSAKNLQWNETFWYRCHTRTHKLGHNYRVSGFGTFCPPNLVFIDWSLECLCFGIPKWKPTVFRSAVLRAECDRKRQCSPCWGSSLLRNKMDAGTLRRLQLICQMKKRP